MLHVLQECGGGGIAWAHNYGRKGVKSWQFILAGKTRLAEAVSGEIAATFYCVSSSDLISSWVGESEK